MLDKQMSKLTGKSKRKSFYLRMAGWKNNLNKRTFSTSKYCCPKTPQAQITIHVKFPLMFSQQVSVQFSGYLHSPRNMPGSDLDSLNCPKLCMMP